MREMHRSIPVIGTLLLLAVVLALPANAAVKPDRSPEFEALEFRHTALDIQTTFPTAAELTGTVSRSAQNDLSALGLTADQGRMDVRSGRWATLLPSTPLIPGDGVGNQLSGLRAADQSDAEFRAQVWEAFAGYLSANAAQLRFDLAQMSRPGIVTVREGGDMVQIWVPRVVDGIPVRDSYLTAVISHGNLVLLGSQNWGDFTTPLQASLTADDAAFVVGDHLSGFDISGVWRRPTLLYVPMSTGSGLQQDFGRGLEYRLVWAVRPALVGELARWEGLVDAASGELIAFEDTNHYASARQVAGGVYPTSNDGTPPDGVEQGSWPMPFATVQTTSGAQVTDSGGNLPGAVTGDITADLTGPFIRMNDDCGPISLTSPGDIDFGTSVGDDCVTPGFGGTGNTHSSRTGFFELNRIIEQARGWLPGNSWLDQQLLANMNINSFCNAFWSGSVNFYRSGGGCGNTGELAGVFDHEWGHGMDDNDANPSISFPGEGIADLYAGLRLDTSCIGRGFFGGNCSGYGDPCIDCTGIRDIDWAKRASGVPHDYSWSLANCGTTVHCQGAVYSEAVWDIYTRNLPADSGMDKNTALEATNRLTYLGAGNVGSWFSGGPPFGGCGATGGYLQYLAADDDNGNINDGTPHMTAIFNAFNLHEIACATPAVVDSGCVGTPTSAPIVGGTPLDTSVNLNWGAVAGASSYQVFRADGVFGCDFGKAKVGETSGTSFLDIGLQNTRDYSYVVIPMGPAASCMGPASACTTVAPQSGPNLIVDGGSAVLNIVTGDGDQFLDNCEMAGMTFDVVNTGIGTLTNVRVIGVTSPSHPSISIDTVFPSPVSPAMLAEGATGVGSFDLTADGLTFNDTVVFEIEVTADEMAVSKMATVEIVPTESDFQNFANLSYDFESDTEGWTVLEGTFNRDNVGGGGSGTTWYETSSSLLEDQCDVIRSPVVALTPTSTMSLDNWFDIEAEFTPGVWYDRANVGIYDVAADSRTPVNPDGGRPYNASGANGTCSQTGQDGWAGVMTSWAASSWSATALDSAGLAGTPVQIEIRYGTDPLEHGLGFRFDQVSLTDVDVQVPDAQSNVCDGGGIPCGDIRKFQNRCQAPPKGNRLQGRILLTDSSHDGEMVTFMVDGSPIVVPVVGSKAQWTINGAASGNHTVELTTPAGCFPLANVSCQ